MGYPPFPHPPSLQSVEQLRATLSMVVNQREALEDELDRLREKQPCTSCENYRINHNRMVMELLLAQATIIKLRAELEAKP
jgi:hypothetical protein